MHLNEIPKVPFDESTIVQVMGNLIGNAIKFSPQKANIHIFTEKLDKHIEFSVKDEGQGISNEDQKLLFGEFQVLSTKPTGGEKSTGLGLAIVKKIVNLHGGEVGVRSKLGEGSTFLFRLPIQG